MMSHPEACTALTRMEASLRDTRHNLYELERSLRDRAETETIDSRPKMRRYNRRMSNWTGKDEEAYLNGLNSLTENAAADLDRLRRKIERQDAAIDAEIADTDSLAREDLCAESGHDNNPSTFGEEACRPGFTVQHHVAAGIRRRGGQER